MYANRVMIMQALKVGIREFRAQLPHYLLEVGEPIAVTRHGATIGYFIPAQLDDKSFDLSAIKKIAESLDSQLKAAAIDEDELVAAFRLLRIIKR